MLSGYFRRAMFAAALLKVATSKSSTIVPQDLQTAFASSGVEVQVSYTNDSVDGFADGATFQKDQVTNEPTFALGDASGITPSVLYTILLIDTTCDNARTLHYARTNFKYDFDIVEIVTSTDAEQAYKAPGSFGETGDDRKYSFLMYTQPGNNQISTLKLPDEGKAFDAKQFESDNGFVDAEAGVGMVVKLGGTANCDGTTSPQSSSAPGEASSAAASTPAPSQAAPAGPSATTNQPEAPSSTSTAGEVTVSSTQPVSGRTTDLVAATSVLQSAPAPSTLVPSSLVPIATGSSTGTGATPQQTTSGASASSLGAAVCVVVASMLAFAGLLAW